MKTTLPIMIGVSLALGATGAWAQAAQNAPPRKDSSNEDRIADAGKVRGTLEEILVTAQKQEERLQDVPISVAVIGGVELDQSSADGLFEMLNRVPGVSTTSNILAGQSQLTIRGVTAGTSLFGGASPIGYYLDSVPFGLVFSAIVPDTNPYDLDRVEVLRGPQGTLYGASAQNGVVRVLTNEANVDAFELKARTSGSTTDGGGTNYRGDMAVNVPLIDGKLAVRGVVGTQYTSGWIDTPTQRDVNDGDSNTYRLKIDAHPTDELSIGLSGWRSTDHEDAPSASREDRRISFPNDQPIQNDFDTYGLTIGYDLPSASLSSATSYIDYESTDSLGIATTLPFFYTENDSRIFSEELLLSSRSTGPWKWSAGVFYRDGKDHLLQEFFAPTDLAQTSKQYAAFGSVGKRFYDDKLEWTLGLRYFHDKVGQLQDGASIGDDTFNSTTPRAALTWHPSSDVMMYASYSQGFRSGFPQDGLVIQVLPGAPPAKPDKLTNYELGAKGTLWDRRVTFDAAVYYITWKDIQQQITVPLPGGGGANVVATINTNTASGVGTDLALSIEPVDGLQLTLTGSWNDLKNDEAVFSDGQVLFSADQRLNLSPEWTVGASVGYAASLGGSGFKGTFSTSANYTSELSTASIGAPPVVGESVLIARANIGIESSEHWTASLFADNLTNADAGVIRQFGFDDWTARPRPRTIGLQLEYRY